eukprot:255901-Prymnesium_polylepis.1
MVVGLGLEVVAIGALGNALRKTELGGRVANNLADAYTYVASAIGSQEEEAPDASPPVRVSQPLRQVLLPTLHVDPSLVQAEGDSPPPAAQLVMCTPGVLEQLAAAAPRRYGDTGAAWNLIFYTSLHGCSLAHLLRRTAQVGPCLLVIADSQGRAFGAFCSELRDRASDSFYGVGETFLFALERMVLPALPERQLSSPSPSKGRCVHAHAHAPSCA